jgi:puromycin-sensitive aminopeptidase
VTEPAPHRLPRAVTPSRYDLRLEIDLDEGRFSGTEDVAVTVHEPTTEVVLNAKRLEVSSGSLRASDGRVIEVATVGSDADAERVTMSLASAVEPGEWVLTVAFRGGLDDRLAGLYRSTYRDGDGKDRVIGTTHFEPSDARAAFPCWDEPDLKAVFAVTLVVREGLTALSNGPEVARTPLGDGTVEVRFGDTMTMSTYLVCMVVGPLALTEPRDARGVPIRVACRPGQEHLADFALDTATFCLDWFGDYYAFAYPEAKLDNVALPDFAQGAMENVGLVTYREALLLLDPETSTHSERLDVAETIAHELAHMWFGDLVTMRWWNGIWLNEAFATFMSYLAVDAMRPGWRPWDTFMRQRANAFEVDALETTRAIEYPVHSPHDASGMFDTLTYTKGGAVLRMLEQWLGAERFRDGIRRYLRTFAHGNTETHDLWDALEEETGEPVRRVMDAWIFQKGYPAISVTRDGDLLRFRQRRFIPSDPEDATTWPVPLIVRQVTSDGVREDRILIEADGASLPLADEGALVVANAGGASFVRAFYDDDLRARLVARVQDALTAVERQCLVDDAWAAVTAGAAPVSSFLDLVAGFADEDDRSVWQAILTGLTWCDRFLDADPRDRFRDFVRGLLRPSIARLGWDPVADETELDGELRAELIRALGILGDDPETQAQARETEAQARAGEDVDASVAAAAVDIVATVGGPDEYETFRARSKDAPTPQEQLRYLEALSRFRVPALMDRTLASTLDDVRPQDAPYLLARSVMNRELGPKAWAFISGHWDELNDRLASSNVIALAAGVRSLTAREEVAMVQSFFKEHDIPQSRMMLQQTLERQRVMAALRERVTPELEERFGR